MTKRRVEVVVEGGFKEGYIHREFGDIFSTENHAVYVQLGWCKDVETGEVGEFKTGAQKIEVKNILVDLKYA